jgi:hypothetical protein
MNAVSNSRRAEIHPPTFWLIVLPVMIGLIGLFLYNLRPDLEAEEGKTIALFNGKDLTNFYTWLAAPTKGEKPIGKNNDTDRVFSVHDGMIHVSGKLYGGLITEQEYENYHLVVEFKWGEKTYPPREGKARDSGVLLHCTGEDGAVNGWLEAYECQMIEGGTGDIIFVAPKGKRSLTVESEKRKVGKGDKEDAYFKPGGDAVMFDGGRIDWYGRDSQWEEKAGFRGKEDVEKPLGEWNTLECICDGDKLTYILNDKTVNAATKLSVTKGKILIQSEGAEVFFRKIELRPIKK